MKLVQHEAFSGHRSRESLADYCQLGEDQRINNTAMLIPFSLHESNLDEYDNYEGSTVIEEHQEGLTEIEDYQESPIIIEKYQEVLTVIPEVTEVPKVIEANPAEEDAKIVKNHQEANSLKSRIFKPKSRNKNASVMAPFKPPVNPNSPLFNSYHKNKKSLSDISNNIIIKLPA
ncbi:9908_t:CDS:2, partial [Dentiscutata heterogama]